MSEPLLEYIPFLFFSCSSGKILQPLFSGGGTDLPIGQNILSISNMPGKATRRIRHALRSTGTPVLRYHSTRAYCEPSAA